MQIDIYSVIYEPITDVMIFPDQMEGQISICREDGTYRHIEVTATLVIDSWYASDGRGLAQYKFPYDYQAEKTECTDALVLWLIRGLHGIPQVVRK